MKLRKLALPVAAAVAMTFAGAASADTLLTLLGPIQTNTVGPQSESNPCIIAGTTCQQPDGFGYNNFKQTGNIFDYDMWSTTPTAEVADGVQGTPYTVSQLNALGSSFVVAIDVNTADNGETLHLFEVWDVTNNTRLYHYGETSTLIGNIANNGNGYGDWTLGDISFAGLAASTQILFHAVWSGASDGAESFFLVPTTAPIPEPETYAMMLVGFSLLGFVARRRKQSLGNVATA